MNSSTVLAFGQTIDQSKATLTDLVAQQSACKLHQKRGIDGTVWTLGAGNNCRATVTELPRLNHLFQPAATGGPTEYGRIEEALASAALQNHQKWLARLGKP